uniref:FAD-binding FR-type domain-containing protein n=1 Tax=Alexandrium monilatum TaxID=311494 RepID=A0A7S4RYN9_9DINO
MASTHQGGCIKVCESCVGSEPLLCDLEDLCPYLGTKVTFTECLGRCKDSPNCLVLPARGSGRADAGAYDRLAALGLPADLADVWASADSGRAGKGRKKRDESDDSRGKRRRKKRDGSDDSGGGRRRRKREGGEGGPHVATKNWTFEDSLKILAMATRSSLPELPEPVLQRARLRSRAMRLAGEGAVNRSRERLAEAEALLSEAIALEAAVGEPPAPRSRPLRLRLRERPRRALELLLLRGELRGTRELGRTADALADLQSVIGESPQLAHAWAEKGKVLRRACRHADALAAFREALRLADLAKADGSNDSFGLPCHVRAWVGRCVSQLEERLRQDALLARGGAEFGASDAGDNLANDSGNGSGWWKLARITGVSWNTCIYHFENHPPAVPHPLAHDAWHVKVCFGEVVREYTPVSTAAEWERGKLRLLVKTYARGSVSRRFAQLRAATDLTDIEEQRCWAQISVPLPTLKLERFAATAHLALIAGGTGVAPALQLLREVIDPQGALGTSCRATLVYSSGSPEDVFLLDELRHVEKAAGGRVRVHHTLTSEATGGAAGKAAEREAVQQIREQHHGFASRWNPFQPKGGPLGAGSGEDGGLRGRASPEMMKALLAPPGPATRVVVSGPPQMLEDVRAILLGLGHSADALVELEAFSVAGSEPAAQSDVSPKASE